MEKIRRRIRRRLSKIQYTKKAMTWILVMAFVFIEQSYVLAFLDKPFTLEDLSRLIAEIVLGTFATYCLKSFFETKEQKKMEDMDHEEQIDEP